MICVNQCSLGQGDIGHMFHEPPDNIHDREGRGQRKTEVGFKGFMADKIAGISGNNKSSNKKAGTAAKTNKKTSTTPAAAKTDTLNSKGSSTSNKNKEIEMQSGKQQKLSPSSSSSSSGTKTAAERLQERKNARAMKRQQKV